jgi:ribosomal protein L7/L12
MNPAPICEWCGANIAIENSFKIDDKILELVKKKHLLAAVKLYKDKTRCSLIEAKDYIDKIKI